MNLPLRFVALAAAPSLIILAACGDTTAPSFTTGPSVQQNPNPAVPLAAIISATTDEPSELIVEVSDGENSWTIPGVGELTVDHNRPVLGFRPGRDHTVTVTARDAAGNETQAAEALDFAAPPLPDDFPPIELKTSTPARMEPGVTLFSVMKWPVGGAEDSSYGLALAVDDQGDVVWYYRTDEMFEDPFQLPNGNLLLMVHNNRIEEVDMLGNLVSSWNASEHPNAEAKEHVKEGSVPVATDTLHHEVRVLESGNFLSLSTELREIDGFPTDVVDRENRAKSNVVGDVIIEFAPDGSTVNEWQLLEMLDPFRLGYESLTGIWNVWAYVDAKGGTRDWAHANSVFHDVSDDSIVVSLRHQEAVIKFSRQTGELIWILGTHDGWDDRWKPYLLQPEGDLEWPYHQHAAEITPQGTLLLFDNGNFRAMPPKEQMPAVDSYSRAVEYSIDTESMTVREVWSYGGPGDDRFFSPFISEADKLPTTGNILITDGGRVRDEHGLPSDAIVGGRHWARILEVTHSDPPVKVFELVVDGDDDELGWAIYRSDRLTGFYKN